MVQIDMPMPKSCFECPLKTVEMDFENEFFYYCPKIKQDIRGKKYDKQRFRKCPLKEVKEALENRKTGHWVRDEMSIMFDIWVCSECGGGGDKHFKYCPHCGAKMEGDKQWVKYIGTKVTEKLPQIQVMHQL